MAPGSAAPTAALPVFYELAAPKGWRAIDFISDLHLSAALPRTVDAWSRHLRHTPADAVFILGDLFEAWVGDDARMLPFESHCRDVLADAASRRHVAFMVGNRDFLVGAAMLADSGMMGLQDPTVLSAWGQRLLLTHGDALCLADVTYQAFRKMVRDSAYQAQFLARPLDERFAIAAQIRQKSEARWQSEPSADNDIDAATAVAWLHATGTAEMVHGHTHRPGSEALAPGFQRHVLSDWDVDGDRPRAQVLRLTRDGFQRLTPASGR